LARAVSVVSILTSLVLSVTMPPELPQPLPVRLCKDNNLQLGDELSPENSLAKWKKEAHSPGLGEWAS
jgi:hypothetical protein